MSVTVGAGVIRRDRDCLCSACIVRRLNRHTFVDLIDPSDSYRKTDAETGRSFFAPRRSADILREASSC